MRRSLLLETMNNMPLIVSGVIRHGPPYKVLAYISIVEAVMDDL